MQSRKSCFLAFLLIITAAAVNAQQRVFVSAINGNDANACTATAPCRSFAQAMTVVAIRGEILALDSGGFGPVTITHAVSIVSPLGVEGSITQSTTGDAAITITAGAGDDIILRGLSI